jgi:hypothetical protein
VILCNDRIIHSSQVEKRVNRTYQNLKPGTSFGKSRYDRIQ